MSEKNILFELRTKSGMSQDELAEKIFVTRQAVSKWENGETVPNTETLKLLSKLFNVSINTLLGSPHKLIEEINDLHIEGMPKVGKLSALVGKFVNLEYRLPNGMIELKPLDMSDRERFILDNQEAFNYGALEEFGCRDNHFEEEGEIISRETIEASIDAGEAYRIMMDNQSVGGLVIKVDGDRGDLDLLFVSPKVHSRGIGYAAWCQVELLHPEVKVWETVTPYFEKRNIHFYVNRCGFNIVEFYNGHHPAPNDPEAAEHMDEQFPDGMFRFEKKMR